MEPILKDLQAETTAVYTSIGLIEYCVHIISQEDGRAKRVQFEQALRRVSTKATCAVNFIKDEVNLQERHKYKNSPEWPKFLAAQFK